MELLVLVFYILNIIYELLLMIDLLRIILIWDLFLDFCLILICIFEIFFVLVIGVLYFDRIRIIVSRDMYIVYLCIYYFFFI